MEPYSPNSLIFRQRVEREIPRLLAAFVVFPAVWESTRRICSASS
jgi:hypothetical protein